MTVRFINIHVPNPNFLGPDTTLDELLTAYGDLGLEAELVVAEADILENLLFPSLFVVNEAGIFGGFILGNTEDFEETLNMTLRAYPRNSPEA